MLRRISGAITIAIISGAVMASPAAASHEPGGIYKGATETGAPVEISLSDDGTEVIFFSVTEVPGTTLDGSAAPCTTGRELPGVTPIVAEHFEMFNGIPGGGPNSEGYRIEGTFGASGTVSGTVQMTDGDDAGCKTPTYVWSAKLSANSNDVCERAKAKLKKAKKQLRQADSPEAKEKAKKKVKKAKKDVALFCD
jgi:hypothetical protein